MKKDKIQNRSQKNSHSSVPLRPPQLLYTAKTGKIALLLNILGVMSLLAGSSKYYNSNFRDPLSYRIFRDLLLELRFSMYRARICKLLRSPGFESKESIGRICRIDPPGFKG
jgi:hypothetical protein